MLHMELITNDEGTKFVKHWTDEEGKVLLQVETGDKYGEAIDIYPCPFTYEEVDEDEASNPDTAV